MSTYNRLDLKSLGSWPTMPKNFPGTATMYPMFWVLMLLLPHGSLTVLETTQFLMWKLRFGTQNDGPRSTSRIVRSVTRHSYGQVPNKVSLHAGCNVLWWKLVKALTCKSRDLVIHLQKGKLEINVGRVNINSWVMLLCPRNIMTPPPNNNTISSPNTLYTTTLPFNITLSYTFIQTAHSWH